MSPGVERYCKIPTDENIFDDFFSEMLIVKKNLEDMSMLFGKQWDCLYPAISRNIFHFEIPKFSPNSGKLSSTFLLILVLSVKCRKCESHCEFRIQVHGLILPAGAFDHFIMRWVIKVEGKSIIKRYTYILIWNIWVSAICWVFFSIAMHIESRIYTTYEQQTLFYFG